MLDRVKCKKFARMQLKKRWLIPLLMTLITTVIIGMFEYPEFSDSIQKYMAGTLDEELTAVSSTYSSIRGFFEVLISFVLSMAEISVYLKMSKNPAPVKFESFLEGFNLWWKAVLAGLWTSLWAFLWSLLLIIPGIIKAFAYSMTFFLLAEYPALTVRKATKISIMITKGHKGEIFMTSLSFLGWALLCILTCGIGFIWLKPYYNMTFTNVYHSLLKEALERKVILLDDLN